MHKLFTIDLNKNIKKQVCCIKYRKNINIITNKMASFYSLVKLLMNKFECCTNITITITCPIYESDSLLRVNNLHKYNITLKKKSIGFNIDVYIDNYKINTSSKKLFLNNIENVDTNFILDIFRLFDNIKYYKWEDADVCDFHKHRDSAVYGPASGSYSRINNKFIKIVTNGCCCNYSGGESYFNMTTGKYVYTSCTCFLDRKEINNIICEHEQN